MDSLASYCLTEPGAGSDAAALTTQAVRDGDAYVVDGVKQFISGAGVSDLYLTMARTGGGGAGGISSFLIERHARALLRRRGAQDGLERAADPAGRLRELPCSGRQQLGRKARGFRIAMSGLDGGRLNIGACSLGGAQAALDKSLAYMAGRTAFGQRLTDFQALQFKLADMATELELRAHAFCGGRPRPRRRRAGRDPALRHGEADRHGRGIRRRQRRFAAAWRLRLPRRLRHREDRARPARPPDPRRHERDHARDHRAQPRGPGPTKDTSRSRRSADAGRGSRPS